MMNVTLLLIILLISILLLPYTWRHERTFGGAAGYWQSVLYTYRYAPGYEQIEFDGLRRLQTWLLLLLTTVVSRLQPELVAWMIELIRRLMGW